MSCGAFAPRYDGRAMRSAVIPLLLLFTGMPAERMARLQLLPQPDIRRDL